MELVKKKPIETIMISELCCGEVVGSLSADEKMNYYIYGYDVETGSNTFTNLKTGEVLKIDREEKFYYFPNASFSID